MTTAMKIDLNGIRYQLRVLKLARLLKIIARRGDV